MLIFSSYQLVHIKYSQLFCIRYLPAVTTIEKQQNFVTRNIIPLHVEAAENGSEANAGTVPARPMPERLRSQRMRNKAKQTMKIVTRLFFQLIGSKRIPIFEQITGQIWHGIRAAYGHSPRRSRTTRTQGPQGRLGRLTLPFTVLLLFPSVCRALCRVCMFVFMWRTVERWLGVYRRSGNRIIFESRLGVCVCVYVCVHTYLSPTPTVHSFTANKKKRIDKFYNPVHCDGIMKKRIVQGRLPGADIS